jgi:methionyl aminopeptidase
LPVERALKDGDVLKIDIGLVHKGWYADMARSYALGKVPKKVHDLIAATKAALEAGIAAAKPGNTFGDIGHAVQTVVEAGGFTVAHGLTGHGIGRRLHEDPYVHNEGLPGRGEELVPGMVIAIEPMTTLGGGRTRQAPDDSFVTADSSLSAHFEHTVAITESGPVVLTQVQ